MNSIGFAHLDPGDLGHGVPFVGGLQGSGEECVFRDWLGCEFGVDAGGAEEEELVDAVAVGGVNDVGLDLEVHGDEVGGVGAVSVDAADLGRGEDHEPGLLGGKEGVHVALACQVKLGVGAQDKVGKAQVAELPHDGRADQAPVAGDEDLRRLVAGEG